MSNARRSIGARELVSFKNTDACFGSLLLKPDNFDPKRSTR